MKKNTVKNLTKKLTSQEAFDLIKKIVEASGFKSTASDEEIWETIDIALGKGEDITEKDLIIAKQKGPAGFTKIIMILSASYSYSTVADLNYRWMSVAILNEEKTLKKFAKSISEKIGYQIAHLDDGNNPTICQISFDLKYK